ncbi:hypothetical protein HU811_01075 [Pseudomonas sp. SWRI196]|uniref:Lipoprotein n=1 Tax=Pseudomonas tehranensis TaxID=2745502 RepID=A0ABR6UL39_9PSED|nr:hypothetical protein [Pseudomonas tehranensis]MBC3345224.1 hypothetical protein [Pseudomonas tehranensis]
MSKSIAIMLGLLLLCVSCANLNSIHRQRGLASGPGYDVDYVSIDAKQRTILSAYSNNRLRVCAEYMPDIFSVISSSLSGQAGYGLGADTKDISVKLAQALSESGASIRRSQTVNLLAMSMYRTCERYLSGSIDQDEMIIQAARDQRMMVSVLAIEQLTGVAQAQNTVIVNAGAASATTDSSTVKALETAKAQADTQKEISTKAAQTYHMLLEDAPLATDGKTKSCESITDSIKLAACVEAKRNSEFAAANQARQEAYYQALLNTSKATGAATITQVANDTVAGQQRNAPMSDTVMIKLADTVLALATLGVAIDDDRATCNVVKRNLLLYSPEQLAKIDTCSEKTLTPVDKTPDSIGPLLNVGLFIQLTDSDNQTTVAALETMFIRYFGPQFRTHAVYSTDATQAPADTEIRYFFDQDQFIARNISIALKTPLGKFPKCTKWEGAETKAKAGVLQLWVSPNTVIGDVTPKTVSFAQVAGEGCST